MVTPAGVRNPSRSSNPGPPAPLGPAPAPRAPRGLPPLSALPLTPAPPGSLCSGSVAGTGDVATRRGAAWKIHVISSCEPPSDQPQEACLPPQQERRRCLGGGWFCSRNACATAAQHARPHAREGKGSPRTERRVPQRAGQRAAHLAVRLLQRPRTQEQRAPCLRRTCCHAWGLSSLSFVGGRIKRPTGRGGMAVRPRTPRGTAMSLDPCLQCTASARRERSSAIETKGLATCSV